MFTIAAGRYRPHAQVIFVDLDQTLITSSLLKPSTPLAVSHGGTYYNIKRPGATRLLNWLKNHEHCEVYILSAGSPSHVASAVKGFGFHMLVDGYISMDDVYGTELQDLHRRRRWILIEDRPLGDGIVLNKMRALGNLHASHYRHVKPFDGDPNDRELLHFMNNPHSLTM